MNNFTTKFKDWSGEKLIKYTEQKLAFINGFKNNSYRFISDKDLFSLRYKLCELISAYDTFHFYTEKVFTPQIKIEIDNYQYKRLNKLININFFKYIKLLRKDCSRMINKIDEVMKWEQ